MCSDFFQAYVPRDSVVLDVAAGYCEFINHIEARKKIALDLNPDVQKFKNPDVQAIVSGSTDMGAIAEGSIDVAFTSNFFEHLTRPDIVKTICEVRRVLKAGGSFLILQPNYRYCYRDYWMFFDHVTALDDRSLSEVLEVNGFRVVECRPRFLPYTTKSRLPRSIFLVKVYLRMPFAHRFFGQQAFVVAKKAE
ncbi:MAG: methyltransferase domain-containing protein [Planctomycetes bacterium]|nr:methyltransferase domain-containing protein [Planctomycetota bacterium]